MAEAYLLDRTHEVHLMVLQDRGRVHNLYVRQPELLPVKAAAAYGKAERLIKVSQYSTSYAPPFMNKKIVIGRVSSPNLNHNWKHGAERWFDSKTMAAQQ